MNLKSHATPLVLLVLALLTLVNITIHVSILVAPCIYQALVATLKFTKALLQTAFAGLESIGTLSTYYFYPITEDHPLDVLTGAILSDLGRTIAAFGRAGGRICE